MFTRPYVVPVSVNQLTALYMKFVGPFEISLSDENRNTRVHGERAGVQGAVLPMRRYLDRGMLA